MSSLKYVPPSTRKSTTKKNHGCPIKPERWLSGPDPIKRDQYYAWLKHKAQARFRGEDYSLTVDEWYDIWDNGNWERRGRSANDFCLMQLEPGIGWHKHNVEVVERIVYLQRMSEYRALKNGQ